jgi:cytochrome subunit of sulfide dehydrogenase
MRTILTGLLLALGSLAALAQQPAPAFAPANLTARGMADLAANCAACHGTNGRPAPGSALGPLAGRPKAELAQAMAQFKSGGRPATVMHQIAKGYSDAEIAAIAEHFSKLPR